MAQYKKDNIKTILLAIYTFLFDCATGYGIYAMFALPLPIILSILGVIIISSILIPWNAFISMAVVNMIKKHKNTDKYNQ